MPIPSDVVRAEFRGTSPGGEIWQTGYWMDGGGHITNQADLFALASAMVAPLTTWWNAIRPSVYIAFVLTELRLYYYATSGVTADFATAIPLSPSPGTFSNPGGPIDTCVVVSTRTQNVGRSHRGRIYIPCHTTVTGSTGMLSSTVTNQYCTSTAGLITAVNTLGSRGVVMSSALANTFHITQCQTTPKPDVQRRRQNRLTPPAPFVVPV